MVELLSRHDDERPARPCQLAALSGRRAAQDGHGTVPGGPERAGTQPPGEALSAGRVAAPDQLPGEGLGRGHSAARVTGASAQRAKPAELFGPVEARPCERAGLGLFQAMARAVVVLGLLVGPASAENFVKPGDTGQIQFQVQHETESGGNIEGLTLTLTKPAHFIVKGTSILGPLNAAPGETKTFVIDYEIAAGTPENPTPEGPFTVGLRAVSSTEDMDPEAVETSVKSVMFSV